MVVVGWLAGLLSGADALVVRRVGLDGTRLEVVWARVNGSRLVAQVGAGIGC